MHSKYLFAATVAILGLLLTGCPSEKPGSKAQVANAPKFSDQQSEHDAGLELSLFKGSPMLTSPPDAISFSRDASILWVHGLDREKNEFYVSQSEVGKGELLPKFYTRGADLIGSYAQASPDGEECLVLSQIQPGGKGPVRDVIYRVGDAFPEKLKHRSMVPWEGIKGIPPMQEETFAFTKPFYSWDAKTIIIPFNGNSGAALVDKQTGAADYVAYPPSGMKNGYTGSAFGPLPDEDGKHRIWGSFWYRGANGADDQSEVYMLDLDTSKWELVFSVNWPVYQCSATKPSVDPWLVSGAYSNMVSGDPQVSEYQRSGFYVPRFARVVPGAGTEDIVDVYGEPVWEIALDPYGGKVFYADMQRQGLVRLSPADGKLDFDPRWFTKEDQRTHLFIGGGGDRCYIWQSDVLIQAKFKKHEDQKGYDE